MGLGGLGELGMNWAHNLFRYRSTSERPDAYVEELPSELQLSIKMQMYSNVINSAAMFEPCSLDFKRRMVLLLQV